MPPEIPGVDVGAVIGRGGNATVYAGVQRAVGRPVAVKVDDRAVTQERNQRRFAREATAAGRISGHPHVVSLIDAGTTGDHHPYLVMELCDGGSLADLLRRSGPLPLRDALDIGIAITGALAAAHEAGILHRDVKPGNVLIDSFGTPRLSDFGLAARQLVDGDAFSATIEALTPAYAPPEVFAHEVPTVRSDVWSMGATIYAMLVGGQPRRRADGGSLSLTELVAALPAPLAPVPGAEALMPVLWRATAFESEQRHATATELRADLVRVREELGGGAAHRAGGPEVTVVTGPPSVVGAAGSALTTTPPPARRGTRVALLVGAVALGVAVGAGSAWAALGGGEGGDAGAQEAPASSSSGTGNDGGAEGAPTEPTSQPSSEPTPVDVPTPPATNTCFAGIVTISGNVSASPVPCDGGQAWETYASGLLPEDAVSARADDVAASPEVQAACTTELLVAHLGADVDPATVTLEVIPPSEAAFLAGERGFSCVVAAR